MFSIIIGSAAALMKSRRPANCVKRSVNENVVGPLFLIALILLRY
jgi:hypothetical protein